MQRFDRLESQQCANSHKIANRPRSTVSLKFEIDYRGVSYCVVLYFTQRLLPNIDFVFSGDKDPSSLSLDQLSLHRLRGEPTHSLWETSAVHPCILGVICLFLCRHPTVSLSAGGLSTSWT